MTNQAPTLAAPVALSPAADHLGQLVDRVRMRGEHIPLTRKGTPAVVMVPIEWWERVAALLAASVQITDADIEAWHEADEATQ